MDDTHRNPPSNKAGRGKPCEGRGDRYSKSIPYEFAAVPYGIASDGRLSLAARGLIPALLYWAVNDPGCEPSDRTLAGFLNVSVSTVRRALKELQDAGYAVTEHCPKTKANATGRIIILRWRIDPSCLPDPPPREAERRGFRPRKNPEVQSPMTEPFVHGRPNRSFTRDREVQSPMTDKEDRVVERENLEKRPGDRSLERHDEDNQPILESKPIPTSPSEAFDPELDSSPEPPPTPQPEPTKSLREQPDETGLTDGQRAFLATLKPEERTIFDAMPPKSRATLLDPHTNGLCDVPCILNEIMAKLRPVAPPPAVDLADTATTEDLIASLAVSRDPTIIHRATRALMLDIGDHERSWRFINRLIHRVYQGSLPAEAILIPLGKTKAERDRGTHFHRGMAAYFVKSTENWLLENDWRPESPSIPIGAPPRARIRAGGRVAI
jgi:hypothetical protein